jgi:hypothetical protein
MSDFERIKYIKNGIRHNDICVLYARMDRKDCKVCVNHTDNLSPCINCSRLWGTKYFPKLKDNFRRKR